MKRQRHKPLIDRQRRKQLTMPDDIQPNDNAIKPDCSLLFSIWRKQPPDAQWFCISIAKRGPEDAKARGWKDRFFKRDQFNDVQEYVDHWFDTHNVFATLRGFTADNRREGSEAETRLAYADLDTCDPRRLPLEWRPHVAWETSPGRYHGVWLCDDVVEGELNEALTAFLTDSDGNKPDPSGADAGQVLRPIVGTINHKYADRPRVDLMWDERTTRQPLLVSALHRLPAKVTASAKSGKPIAKLSDPEALKIFHRYTSRQMTSVVHAAIKNGVQQGKRSDMIWSCGCKLIELQCSLDDIHTLLMASPLNKYWEHKDGGGKEMYRMLSKAEKYVKAQSKIKSFAENDDAGKEFEFGLTTMADVTAEQYDWLWQPYIAYGEMTTLDGLPEAGKSFLAQYISICVCDGATDTPNGKPIKQGRVLYFDFENSKEKSTKNRLVNMGCKNMDRFHIEDVRFTIRDPEAMDAVRRACQRDHYDLVVFDTLNRYLAEGTDIKDVVEATHAQDQFIDIARQNNCAVLVLRHPNKSESSSAKMRVSGSIAMLGVPRLGMAVAEYADDDHPWDEEHRGMLPNKLSDGPRQPMITYRIVPADRPGPGKLEFGELIDGVNLDELYARTWAKAKWKEDEQDGDGGSKADEKEKARGHAERFILDALSSGPRDCAAVELEAEGRAGLFGKATFRRAVRDLKENGKLVSEPNKLKPKERVYRLVADAKHLGNGVIRVDFGACAARAKLGKAHGQPRVKAGRMKRTEA